MLRLCGSPVGRVCRKSGSQCEPRSGAVSGGDPRGRRHKGTRSRKTQKAERRDSGATAAEGVGKAGWQATDSLLLGSSACRGTARVEKRKEPLPCKLYQRPTHPLCGRTPLTKERGTRPAWVFRRSRFKMWGRSPLPLSPKPAGHDRREWG